MSEEMKGQRVFIVNDSSGHDFSKANVFGRLVVMTTGRIDRYGVAEMVRAFNPFVEESEEDDYILHTGPGVMSAIACSLFAARHKRLNLLIWRAEGNGDDKYIFRKVVF